VAREHIGYYETLKEASDAHNKRAKEVFGDFACVVEVEK